MKYPNIEFKKLSLEDNIEIVKWAYNQEDSLNTKKQVEEYFPGINEDNIEVLVTDMYNEVSNELLTSVNNYTSYWNLIYSDYYEYLFDYLEVNEYTETLTVYVGLLPIAPRDIQNKEICVNIGMPKNKFLNILTHEVLHFVWFSKFKELFPNVGNDEFVSPNIPWVYSELVTPIILNIESIVKLTNSKEECLYDFMNYEVMSKLSEILNKNISIDERIKAGYEYVKNYFND